MAGISLRAATGEFLLPAIWAVRINASQRQRTSFLRLAKSNVIIRDASLSDSCHIIKTIEDTAGPADDDGDSDANEDDIEAQIRKEVEGMKSDSKTPRKFQAIKLDIPCGLLLFSPSSWYGWLMICSGFHTSG